MEILLLSWSALLAVWTILLVLASADYWRARTRLNRERMRWLSRCEAWRRQNVGGANEWRL